MPAYRLVIDGARMEDLLRGKSGPVVRYGNVIGDRIIARARSNIRRRFIGPVGQGAGGVTLGNTLVKRWGEDSGGPTLIISAMAPYALWVHNGNKSNRGDGRIWPTHQRADGGTPFLRFVSPGGGFVFARSVRTSTPNPFLRDALREVMATIK